MKATIFLFGVIFLLIGCQREQKQFTSVELVWPNGQKDTLDINDGIVSYLEESLFSDEMFMVYPWEDIKKDVANPIIIKTNQLRYFHINWSN